MSLDVSLLSDTPIEKIGTGVFVREDGGQRELTLDEVRERWPDADVSLDKYESEELYTANITHNLNTMAAAAGLYEPLWRPDESNWTKANDLIPLLEAGLEKLKSDPEKYKKFEPDNGWGTYDGLVEYVENYLAACKANPDARVEVSR